MLYNEMRLKYFLKDWSLKEHGEEYVLSHKSSSKLKHSTELTEDCLRLVKSRLDPEFVDAMLRAYEKKNDQIYKDITQNAINEIKEATGIPAKN